VLNFRGVPQRLVRHDDRESFRGRVLSPLTLPRLN
jgi:hypothetical protein